VNYPHAFPGNFDPFVRNFSVTGVDWHSDRCLIIFGFGIVDDLKIIRPLPKLLGQLLAGSVLIFSGNFVRVFENPAFPLYGDGLFFRGLDIFSPCSG
jgi:hypothetical protein